MEKRVLLLFSAVLTVWLASPTFAAELTATQIIEKADDLTRGLSSYSEMTMKVVTPRYEREVRMKAWTEGREKAFIVILAPEKERGVTFLKQGRMMWNYLPDVERTIKIPPSMMSQGWMGSDLSNNDLSRADSLIVDFDHRLAGEETMLGDACWKIELITKPEAPVEWSKVVVWVAKDTYIMRRAEYYDEDEEIARVILVDRIIEASGRKVGSRMVVENKVKEGHSTTLVYSKIEFDVSIAPGTFEKRNLTSGVH